MKYKSFRIGMKLWLRIEIFEKSQFCNKIKKKLSVWLKEPSYIATLGFLSYYDHRRK